MLRIIGVVVAAVTLAVSAQASHVSGNSSYGGNFGSQNPAQGVGPTSCPSLISPSSTFTDGNSVSYFYTCDADGATITAEAFLNSADPFDSNIMGGDLVMFDFQVSNAPSGMNLVLTPSGAPIVDLGLFFCSGASTDPLCDGTSSASLSSFDSGSLVGTDAVFATSSSELSYFVALDLTAPNDSTSDISVTASFEPASSAASVAPEPRVLLIPGVVMLAVILIFRRRLA